MMSLINEALKRAEAQKLQNLQGPRSPEKAPLLPPPESKQKLVRSSPLVAAVVAALVVAVVAAGLGVFKHSRAGLPNSAVAADSTESIPPAQAVTEGEPSGHSPTRATAAEVYPAEATIPKARKARAFEAEPTPRATRQEHHEEAPLGADPVQAMEGLSLQGIMHGPHGDAALINGQLVRIGQSIGGAKLVRITGYSVVLQKDSRRLELKM